MAGPESTHETAAPSRVIRDDIQGLRALAVVLVVLFHARLPVSGGYIGVDVFFVISGFVITGQLRRQLVGSGRLDLRRFYGRRVKRLLPAAAVMSLVTLIASIVLVSPIDGQQQYAARTAAAASVSVANLYLWASGGGYFQPAAEQNPFLHTWTLSVEEQFYFVLPIGLAIVAFAWRRSSTVRGWGRGSIAVAASAAVLVGTLVSFAFGVAAANGWGVFSRTIPERFAFYSPVTRAWEFGVGVLFALVVPAAGLVLNRAVRWMLALAGAFAIVGAAFWFGPATPFPGTAALLPVSGTLALIASGTGARNPLAPVLENPIAVWIGDRSYGWYLWHWPFIVLADASFPDAPGVVLVVSAAASLVPAAVSYSLIEQPVRGWENVPDWKVARLAAVCVLTPIVAAVGVGVGVSGGWGLEVPVGLTEQRWAVESKCDDKSGEEWSPERCGVGPAGRRVFVLGDSHAASAFEGIADAAESLGYGAAVWFRSSCPFLLGPVPSGEGGECPKWRAQVLEEIDAVEPVLVVVANRSAGYTLPPFPRNDVWRTVEGRDGTPATSSSEAIDLWQEGFAAMLDEFRTRGIPVVILDVVPEFARDFTSHVTLLRPEAGVPTVSMADVELRRRDVLAAEHLVATRYERATTVDPAPALCGFENCVAVDDGTWLYMDRHHLTPDGSKRLTPLFELAFRELLDLP